MNVLMKSLNFFWKAVRVCCPSFLSSEKKESLKYTPGSSNPAILNYLAHFPAIATWWSRGMSALIKKKLTNVLI